jgi:phosphatidate cytidylyltransferase
MNEAFDYLFSTSGALEHPVTKFTIGFIIAAVVLSPVLTLVLTVMRKISPENRRNVWTRYYTWLFLIPVIMGPILLCPASAMSMVCIVSLLCYREYARATGLFRNRFLSALVGIGIFLVFLTTIDHWYRLFLALGPLAISTFAAGSVLADEPKGYLQRVSLAAIGFLLLGSGLGHLGYMANDSHYRPILCLLIVSVQLSDIVAYICGKWFGKRRLFPNTSPNKTLGGHLAALAITAPLAAYLGHLVFRGTPLDMPARLAILGLLVAVGGQMGDLVLGSIKRDIGIKDMAATLPGHGGFLDRFNSLVLVAPAAFHYINVFVPFGLDRAPRVFTGP